MNYSLLNDGKFALGVSCGLFLFLVFFIFIYWLELEATENPTVIVTSIAAFLSPTIAAFIAVYFSERTNFLSRQRDLRTLTETSYVKVQEIQDFLWKQYQHHFSSDPRHHFRLSDRSTLVIKPLESDYRDIAFTSEERALGFRLRNADLVNSIRDAPKKMFDSVEFLRKTHLETFNEVQGQALKGQVHSQDRSFVALADINEADLVRLEEAQEHLRSILSRSKDDIDALQNMLLKVLRNRFGRTISFEFRYDVPAQAPNAFKDS